MAELSTEAKVGKILLIIGVVLGLLSLLAMLFVGSMMMFGMAGLFGGLVYAIIAVDVVGLVVGVLAIKKAMDGEMKSAGIYGIISSLLPPLNIITLIGAILCLVSPEAKK